MPRSAQCKSSSTRSNGCTVEALRRKAVTAWSRRQRSSSGSLPGGAGSTCARSRTSETMRATSGRHCPGQTSARQDHAPVRRSAAPRRRRDRAATATLPRSSADQCAPTSQGHVRSELLAKRGLADARFAHDHSQRALAGDRRVEDSRNCFNSCSRPTKVPRYSGLSSQSAQAGCSAGCTVLMSMAANISRASLARAL